jgi:hypothetical protein
MVGICQQEDAMNRLVFAIVVFSIVPAMRAQQADTSGNPPQTETQAAPLAAPQAATQNPNAQDNLPATIRPGHPLDPADVDILTGKRDREIEAARMAALPISVGMYGNYGDFYAMQGRFGRAFDMPILPLTRISNPFFFSTLQLRGFGRGGFFGGRGR